MARARKYLRTLIFAASLLIVLPGLAFAECERMYSAAPNPIDRSDLRHTMRQCGNESGRTPERRVMAACNALVRLACTPSSGHLLSTEDREILVWAYSMRAGALLDLGRTDEAIADLNDAILLAPGSAPLLTNRCRVRAATNRELNVALVDCNAALQSTPNAPHALDSRALVHLRRGDFDAALLDYDAALRAAPELASSLYGRGVVHARLGNAAASQADIAAAIDHDEHVGVWFTAVGLEQ